MINSISTIAKESIKAISNRLGKSGMHVQPVDQQEQAWNIGYEKFLELSRKSDIKSIQFSDMNCVLTFKDNRKYFFDPTHRVMRLYTVPRIGTFEPKETNFLRQFISPNQICFDVGASFGWYSVLFSKAVGKGGHVYAFEPVPETFSVLERNLSLNQCENATLQMMALDENEGMDVLFLPDIGVSGSFQLHEYQDEFDEIPCAVTRLDTFCKERSIEKVDFIKADIEGAEFRMLRGATGILKRDRPVLMLEVQQHSSKLFGYEPRDLFYWLGEIGYRVFFVSREGGLIPILMEDELPDHNFIFIHRDRHDV